MIDPDEWDTISLLIEEGWPGEFTDAASKAWRVFLNDYDAVQVLGALKRLVGRGGKFRPSVAEVAGEIHEDPSHPTFPEMLALVYDKGGVLKARLPRNQTYPGPAEMHGAQVDAWRARAGGVHPLVLSFCERYGYDRLNQLELHDPEYGELRRKELEVAWDAHCEAMAGRDLAAITASARRGNGQLSKFDPLAALDLPQQQITKGA